MTSLMVAVDTSAFVDYLKGEHGDDIDQLDALLTSKQVYMVPAVLSELLTSTNLTDDAEEFLKSLPSLPLQEGYWVRVGKLRRLLHQKGLKAYLGDTLIAQYCLDHTLPLLTRDQDFKHFERHAKLRLL